MVYGPISKILVSAKRLDLGGQVTKKSPLALHTYLDNLPIQFWFCKFSSKMLSFTTLAAAVVLLGVRLDPAGTTQFT